MRRREPDSRRDDVRARDRDVARGGRTPRIRVMSPAGTRVPTAAPIGPPTRRAERRGRCPAEAGDVGRVEAAGRIEGPPIDSAPVERFARRPHERTPSPRIGLGRACRPPAAARAPPRRRRIHETTSSPPTRTATLRSPRAPTAARPQTAGAPSVPSPGRPAPAGAAAAAAPRRQPSAQQQPPAAVPAADAPGGAQRRRAAHAAGPAAPQRRAAAAVAATARPTGAAASRSCATCSRSASRSIPPSG